VASWLAPAALPPTAASLAATLTAAERAHPFWQLGLGRSALADLEPPRDAPLVPLPDTGPPPPCPPPPPRGVVLHGEVGVGKTMAMDLFYSTVLEAGSVPCMRRVHYNAFMLEISSRISQLSSAGSRERAGAGALPAAPGEVPGAGAPWHVLSELVDQMLREPPQQHADHTSTLIAAIAHDIGSGQLGACTASDVLDLDEGRMDQMSLSPGLLCFDELQMMDVADATVMTGVLRRLTDAGWVIVATCNREIAELAASTQHQRHPQAAFASILQTACEQVYVGTAHGDYREQLAKAQIAADCAHPYLYPLTPEVDANLTQTFRAISGGDGEPRILPVAFGRELRVPLQRNGVACFSFAELCQQSLGAADFMACAEAFHTIILRGVPVLSADTRDHARRFITLVDCLYNKEARLICSGAAPLQKLFDGATLAGVDLEALEFEAEAGKSDELGTLIGNTMAPVDAAPASAWVGKSEGNFTGADEKFAFRRALSRMLEMQSESYARRVRLRAAGQSSEEGLRVEI